MTTPSARPNMGAVLSSPRATAAWALLLYVALAEFFAFLAWILPGGTFAGRSVTASNEFTSLVTMALPLVAILVAAKISPILPAVRTMAAVALIEYAVALFLGVITLLIGLGAVFDGYGDQVGIRGVQFLIMGLAGLLLIAIAAWIVLRVFTEHGGRLPNLGATTGGSGQGGPTQGGPTYPSQPGPAQGGQTYPPPAGPTYPGGTGDPGAR